MRFSIVIPSYNYARYLPRALESALAQPGDDYDVTVIDDGSSDDTAGVVRPYLQAHGDKLKYVYQDNRGLAGARNRGIDETEGDYLLFLDADDRLLPRALQVFRDFLAAAPETDLVTAGHISVDPRGRRKRRPVRVLGREPARNFAAFIHRKISLTNGATVFHRRIFDTVRYPESLRQNEDLVVNGLALARFRCASVPEAVLEVHAHEGRMRHDMDTIVSSGLAVVDLLFDADLLPAPLMKYRSTFLSRYLLSKFRSYYQAGYYKEANRLYGFALRERPVHVFLYSYLKKYLRSLAFATLGKGRKYEPSG